MRDLKFRVWNKISQCIESWESMLEHGDFYRFINNNEYPLMQFTGLTDKNGADIYEGDFIKNKHGRISVVVWHEYSACWDCTFVSDEHLVDSKKAYEGFDNSKWKYNVEIIGNIHQHPELLNNKE